MCLDIYRNDGELSLLPPEPSLLFQPHHLPHFQNRLSIPPSTYLSICLILSNYLKEIKIHFVYPLLYTLWILYDSWLLEYATNWSDQASCWSLCCEGGESAREGWEERSLKWSILFLEWTSKSVLKVQCCVCPTHNPPNFRCRRRLRDERSRALSFIRKLLLCVGEALLT